jgi:hypothetical protein
MFKAKRLMRYLGDVTDASVRSLKRGLDSTPSFLRESVYQTVAAISAIADIPLIRTMLVIEIGLIAFFLSEPGRVRCHVSYSNNTYLITHEDKTHFVKDTTTGFMRFLSVMTQYFIGTGGKRLISMENGLISLDSLRLGPRLSSYASGVFMAAGITSVFDGLRWLHDEFSEPEYSDLETDHEEYLMRSRTIPKNPNPN